MVQRPLNAVKFSYTNKKAPKHNDGINDGINDVVYSFVASSSVFSPLSCVFLSSTLSPRLTVDIKALAEISFRI